MLKSVKINDIDAIILGETSKSVCLYIHGQNGNKDEAHNIENVICGYDSQILSLDLPSHGYPWIIVPELIKVMEYAKKNWDHISICANSIGAWYSMLSFENENIDNCFFISPVLDMKNLISKMMMWAHVSEEELQQRQTIVTDFGQTLSWKYWEYTLSHPIAKWKCRTFILYGEKDNLIDYDTIEAFSKKFHCEISVMKNGEHWFHTDEQIEFMRNWLNNAMKSII